MTCRPGPFGVESGETGQHKDPMPNTAAPDTPVRVLIGNDHLGYGDALHGVGRYLLNITTSFDRSRVHPVPVILRPEPRLSKFFEERGIEVRCLGRSKNDPRALTDLVRIIREERIEVVHVQAFKSDTLGRIAGRITGVPTILHGRDRIAERNLPMLVLDRLLGPQTKHALAVSETVRQYLHRERYIPMENIDVFYHGVDLSVFAGDRPGDRERVRAEYSLEDGAVVAGTSIRLHPSKGHCYLLDGVAEVVKTHPEFHLLIANEGPEEAALRAQIERLGLNENVTLTGSVKDVRAFLSALDIFVMPSLSEGFPNSMLEAMAMSRPIVATSVDGMGEMLTDGENALVVPAADGAALGEALLRLCGDEELRGALSAASLEFAENLSIERTVERLTEIYYRVARSKQAARAGEAVRASR